MPIEEQAPEARINVLQGGNIDQQINVRLAQSKIDYYVPFDLLRYKGETIVMDISTGTTAPTYATRARMCWKAIKQSDAFDSTNVEKYRPAFHHTPVYGWMNDPNGMFYKDGVSPVFSAQPLCFCLGQHELGTQHEP